jgi:hypothetical protein
MKTAECQVHLGDRTVTLAVDHNQLAVRGEGDLITAEIVAVAPSPKSSVGS